MTPDDEILFFFIFENCSFNIKNYVAYNIKYLIDFLFQINIFVVIKNKSSLVCIELKIDII